MIKIQDGCQSKPLNIAALINHYDNIIDSFKTSVDINMTNQAGFNSDAYFRDKLEC